MNKTPDSTDRNEGRSSSFFILLSFCIAVIMISGYMVFGHLFADDSTKNPNVTPNNIPAASVNTQRPRTTPTATPATEDAFSIFGKKKAESFTMPIEGDIVNMFSSDKLIYNETMDDWRVHTGIDIKCEDNAPIYPVASGVVTKVYNDTFMGNCIEIMHNDNTKSLYQSLSGDVKVTTNESVTKDTVIGYASTSAKCEAKSGPHLHLEMYKDDKLVSPLEFIKQ